MSTCRLRRFALSLLAIELALLSLVSTPARAQLQPPSATAAQEDPRELEARAACAAGDVDKGIAILARLFAETGDYTWVYNQGRCYQQNGRAAPALNRFREYLRRGQNLAAEERSEVEGFIKELEAEVARQPAPPAAPSLGDQPAASGPATSAAADPGVSLSTSAAPPPWSWQKKAGVAALAGAGAALGMGVIFHVVRENKAREFTNRNPQCWDGPGGLEGECQTLKNGVKSAGLLMIVGYAGAAVLGGAGGFLLWQGSREPGAATASRGVRLACAPQVGATGVVCGARF